MRAISLVNHLEFEFSGNIARNALALGDLDNDGSNELVIGNHAGDVAIFKERKKFMVISNLNCIVCVAIGDILHKKHNQLVIVTADGWCFIYKVINKKQNLEETPKETDTASKHPLSGDSTESPKDEENRDLKVVCLYSQRIPANTKDILLADIDGDGCIEMVLGLTDRVVRSYKWVSDGESGKLVALNKWECANQIGSITLHHGKDGKPSLLIAQPGGTFMRIKCDNNLVNVDIQKPNSKELNTSTSMVDYQCLGISRMRNQNISTEILGNFKIISKEMEITKDNNMKSSPYAVATLDGTIMLVKDEIILWAMAVDHQIFALTKLDITGTGSDDIVACSWDGQTYILDQKKNCVRFNLEQPVQAFHSGYYNVTSNDLATTCLVYVTFNNTVFVYYDIPLKDLNCRKFKPNFYSLESKFITEEQPEIVKKNLRKSLLNYLLYNMDSIKM